jgi:hypothetical protein
VSNGIEEYFDFLAPDDIRIKGTRVGIESVLYEYIHRERTPEMIQQQFSITHPGPGICHDFILLA